MLVQRALGAVLLDCYQNNQTFWLRQMQFILYKNLTRWNKSWVLASNLMSLGLASSGEILYWLIETNQDIA